jgi:iron complex transport system substrate-binding protein
MTKRRIVRRLAGAFVAGFAVGLAIVAILILRRPQPTSAPPHQPVGPTVATVTPAGTDLVIGIGAADHLVAVSDLDEDRDGTVGLPRVGDFDTIDWEILAAAKPKILVTQYGNRMPPGLIDRCNDLGIQVIDVRLDLIEDLYREADKLGAALNVEQSEQAAVAKLKQDLAAVAIKAAAFSRVRAALAISDGATIGLIGPGSFHDQLLSIAGGINVAAGFHKSYISIDREQLTALNPDVILDLEPVPSTTPQQLLQVQKFWQSMPDLPALVHKRICTITAPYCLRPGWHAAELAEQFAEKLHPLGN